MYWVRLRKLWCGLRSVRKGLAFFQFLQPGPGDKVGSGGIDCVQRLGFEPDSSDLGLWLRHEFSNGFEDDSKLAVVFLFSSLSRRASPLFEPIISRS